ESALAAFQVRYAHSRQEYARKFLGRKSNRHANHGRKNSGLPEPVPKRRSPPHALDLRFAKRNRVFADFHRALWSADFSRGQKRKIILLVAREKIIDIVFARIHAGHERGPCHRRNRRVSRAQLTKRSLLLEGCQIRQLTLRNEPLRKLGIHAIKP